MLLNLRLKLIKLLIGKLSIITNVTVYPDGKVLAGDGLGHNVLFINDELDKRFMGAIRCNRLAILKHAHFIDTYCTFIGRQFYLNQAGGDDIDDGQT